MDALEYRHVVEGSPAALAVLDGAGSLIYVNEAFRRSVGEDLQLLGPVTSLFAGPERSKVAAWFDSIAGGASGRSVYLGPLAVVWSGVPRTVDLSGVRLDEGVADGRFVVSMRDLTPVYRQLHEALTRQSSDHLTGSLNRAAIMARLEQELLDGGSGTLLYLDLDEFKSINDAHGHRVGDQVLVEVAARIRSSLGSDAVLARLGGDEFVVYLPGLPLAIGRQTAQLIVTRVSVPMLLDDVVVEVSLSVGAAELGGTTVDDAIAEADVAMYVAKRNGHGRVTTYDEGLRSLSERRRSLIEENHVLRAAAVRYSIEARTDPGTGLPNLRRLLEDLDEIHVRAVRGHRPYCVLFLDLDHFGALNKYRGDDVGDRRLAQVAEILSGTMREGEVVYRKGGEELVIILWDAEREGGVAAAHRYRQALIDAALSHGGHPLTPIVTASFGVAEGPGEGDAHDVLRVAGLCMLSAKQHGRNRVSTTPMDVPDDEGRSA